MILSSAGNPSHNECAHRRIALPFHNFRAQDFLWEKAPSAVRWLLPEDVRRSWISVLAANAPLPVHAYSLARFRCQRIFRECAQGVPADEAHVLLRCCASQHVRQGFARRFPNHTLTRLLHLNSCNLLPFLVHAALCAYGFVPNISHDLYTHLLLFKLCPWCMGMREAGQTMVEAGL